MYASHDQTPYNRELDYELSLSDPGSFVERTLDTIAKGAVYGEAVMDKVWRGGFDPRRIAVDPSGYWSRNRGDHIVLGTQSMDRPMKERLMFHPERFTYKDEIGFRALHEIDHALLFDIQHTSSGRALLDAVDLMRDASYGQYGLSALGSLPYYGVDERPKEDATELLTMYAWDPSYMAEFAVFLSDPSMDRLKGSVGLASPFDDPKELYDIVEAAVLSNIG